MMIVKTIAELKTLVPLKNGLHTSMIVLGYYAAYDGGGGIFYYDHDSDDDSDDGLTILPIDEPRTGRWKRLWSGALDVRWFGAMGDGKDDTDRLQAALNARPGEWVHLAPGGTHLVSQTSTKNINGTVHYYCLALPEATKLNLNGATLKLAESQNATMLINDGAGSTNQDEDIVIVGPGVLDGNQANQTSPDTGEMPVLRLDHVLRPQVRDIDVINARDYFGRFMGCVDGYFDGLQGFVSHGDGWSFGIQANDWQCKDTQIGSVGARDTRGLNKEAIGNLQGNPFVGVFIRCNVGQVYGENCAGGLKIQDGSKDSNFGSLIFIGGTNRTNNSGVKLQGKIGSGGYFPLERINVANIVSQDCYAEGLRVFACNDCNIGNYVGEGNGSSGSDCRDVLIEDSDGVSIGAISSAWCSGRGLSLSAGADNYRIGRVSVRNCTGRAVQSNTTGSGRIESIVALDDQAIPTMTDALCVTDTDSGSCGSLRTNLAVSSGQSRIFVCAENHEYFLESVVFDNGGDGVHRGVHGIVTLIKELETEPRTFVENSNVMRVYVGGSGDYLHPIIQVLPWNSSAAALGGQFRCSVLDYDDTQGPGFRIYHPEAKFDGTEKVAYRVLGYGVVAPAAA